MEHKVAQRASDEVPFLQEGEKDSYELPLRPARRERWANILPYSVVLNVGLLLALFAVWNLQKHDPSKHYIPNEVYCK